MPKERKVGMTSRHEMVYEGRGKGSRGKRKTVKTKKKGSAFNRWLKGAWHKTKNVLALIGIAVVLWWMFWFVAGRVL
jgi:hypothetical protein